MATLIPFFLGQLFSYLTNYLLAFGVRHQSIISYLTCYMFAPPESCLLRSESQLNSFGAYALINVYNYKLLYAKSGHWSIFVCSLADSILQSLKTKVFPAIDAMDSTQIFLHAICHYAIALLQCTVTWKSIPLNCASSSWCSCLPLITSCKD